MKRSCALLFGLAVAACGAAPTPTVAGPCAPSSTLASPPPATTADADGAQEMHVTQGSLALTVRVSPVANLAYQLDCMAGLLRCSQPVFHNLWASQWSADDDAALATWGAVRRAYHADVELESDAPKSSAVPLPFTGLEYDKRIRSVSYAARSLDDYERLVDLLTRPGDAARLATVLKRFWPRFTLWWKADGRAIIQPSYAGMARLLSDAKVGGLLDRVARFYHPDLPPGTEVQFDLVARPSSATYKTTNGEHVDSHLVLEVMRDTSAEGELGVAAHELFHFFYSARSLAAQGSLVQRLAATKDPLAMVGYGLLDESLATAFGNGVVARAVEPDDVAKRLARDGGLYANRGIDRTAKALLPHADALLGATLDDEASVAAIVHAVHEALGESPPPVEYLHSFAILRTPAFEQAAKAIGRRTQANNTYEYPLASAEAVRTMTDHPQLSGVLMLSRADFATLEGWKAVLPRPALDVIRREGKARTSFVFSVDRGAQAKVFVMVADDESAMEALTEKLASRSEALTGVLR